MLTIIVKDTTRYTEAAIQVVSGIDLYGVLTRNNLLRATQDTMVGKNKHLCIKWFEKLSLGCDVINPNYLTCSMRVAPEKTVLIETDNNCDTCGQILPS